MSSIPTFAAPDFINNQDAATIQKRMMENLPADIDNTEGGFPWDFTKPTALEKAELIEYQLLQSLQLMFPMWATGTWLDYHAQAHGITRKAANAATGKITVKGTVGTVIAKGFVFAAPAVGSQPAVEFAADADYTLGSTGTVEVSVTAVAAGTGGNVSAGTIGIMASPITGITGITNAAAVSGGTSEETDAALRARLMYAISEAEASFVGSVADYKRWAEAVTGVGKASVIPTWNGAGTVKVVVYDANGTPANQTIVDAVYADIVSPGNALLRKAPIGATVTVGAPTSVTISYSFTVTLKPDATISEVKAAFSKSAQDYYTEAIEDGTLRYNRIAAILAGADGVIDFSSLKVNGGTANITITADECPVTGTVTATEAA